MADLADLARDALRQVLDPEAGLNIVDLGLIYDVAASDGTLTITMTFTHEGCPVGPMLMEGARQVVAALPGVHEAVVELTFDPPWTPQSISADGRALLGW
jgi:metal-sulfur cluster biosynthetic enzyme